MGIILLLLLAAYGLCFWLQNKAVFLHRGPFLNRLFECSFCVGAHCGWLTWLAGWVLVGPRWLVGWGLAAGSPDDPKRIVLCLAVWVFGVAAWCYLLDTLARRLEAVSADES